MHLRPTIFCLTLVLLSSTAMAQPHGKKAHAAKPAEAATTAAAPAPTEKTMPLKQSNKQPIEITSDALSVFQEENRAVFSGHVIAIQGDLRLESDTMTVYYRKPEEKGGAKPKEDTGGQVKQDAIKHIDVKGHVVFTTPQDTAVGETGSYDVESHDIRLDDKVVLTHGNNTLKGEHLVYNLDSGQSVLTGGAQASAKDQQAAPTGRVRALFIPDKKADAAKPADNTAAPQNVKDKKVTDPNAP